MKKFTMIFILMMVMVMTTIPMYAIAEVAEPAAEADTMIDLNTILVAAINLIAAVVARYLVPWLRSRTTESQRRKMIGAVNTAVYAAEQLYGPDAGKKKLEQVEYWLNLQGYDINTSEVITAIEAAVQELTLKQSKPPSTPVTEMPASNAPAMQIQV